MSIPKRLLSDENVDYQDELDNLKTFMVAEPTIKGMKVPRFGLYSIFARSLPMYAYDNPDLLKRCKTAFTDGSNVFYSVPFMEKLLSDDAGGRNGMIFLSLHETGHNLFRHFFRCLDFDHDIANRAQDMSMNTRMLRDFVYNENHEMNTLFPLPPALSVGIGFKPGDIEKYAHRSEEDIAREMAEEAQNNPQQKQPGQPGAGGQGSGGGNSNGQGEPSDGSGGMGTDHMISPDELADIFNQAGLGHLIEKLNMPVDANGNIDPVKMEKVVVQHMTNMQNAVTTMNGIQDVLGNRMPGAHSNDYAKQMLGKLNAPKLSWKTSVKEMIVGNGMRMSNSFDHPGDAYMIDPAQMGIQNRLYIGARIPSKPNGFTLALMDTSGSMTANSTWMNEAASEVLGIVSQNKNTASDVVFLQIDTVIRGKAQVITPQNVEAILRESFEARGLGGTCLATGINMAMNSPEVLQRLKKKEKINALLYFTDLGDSPPQREDLPKNLPKKVAYLAVPGTYNDAFAEAVSDYASVISMGDRMSVDLTGDGPISVNGMRARRP